MPELRRLALTAALLAIALTAALAGCSGDASGTGDDGPASVAQFCTALGEFRDDVDAADETDLPAYVATLKTAARELEAVGVPDESPADARRGFALTIDRILALPSAATQEDVAQLGDVSEEDQARLDALDTYIDDACPELTGS